MKVRDVIEQVEQSFGRQSEKLMFRLINDALIDISGKVKHYTKATQQDLVSYQRWYDLSSNMMDIIRIEIKDTNDRYVMIPRLLDYHKLLRGDTDASADSLT